MRWATREDLQCNLMRVYSEVSSTGFTGAKSLTGKCTKDCNFALTKETKSYLGS